MNQPGIFDEIVLYFRSILENFPDKRAIAANDLRLVEAQVPEFYALLNQEVLPMEVAG